MPVLVTCELLKTGTAFLHIGQPGVPSPQPHSSPSSRCVGVCLELQAAVLLQISPRLSSDSLDLERPFSGVGTRVHPGDVPLTHMSVNYNKAVASRLDQSPSPAGGSR